MCINNEMIPISKDSEIIKLFLNFAIMPETSITLEFPNETIGFNSMEEIELIEKMFQRLPTYVIEDKKTEDKL